MADVTSRLRLVVDSTGVDKAGRKLKDLRKGARDADDAAARLRNTFAGLGAVIGAAFSVKQLTGIADQYRGIQNQLRLVTGSAGELRDIQKQVLAVANETGASLDATVRLYANLERFAGGFLKTQQDTLDLTRAINQTAVISGASVTDAGNAVRQLSQAIAGGVLRAEEFNSIVENMPRLAEAIATGLGTSMGGLRKQVNEGLVTSQKLIEALQSQFGTLNQEFLGSAKTIGQALQAVGNIITVELGERLQGAQDIAIKALQWIGANFEKLIPIIEGVAGAAAALAGAFAFSSAITAIGALLTPVGLLVIAIGTVVALRDDIAEWAFGVRDAGAVIQASFEVLTPIFKNAAGAIVEFVKGSYDNLKSFAAASGDIANETRERLANFVPPQALESIKRFASAALDVFLNLAKAIAEAIGDAILLPIRAIEKLYGLLANFGALPENIRAQFAQMENTINSFADAVDKNSGAETIDAIGNAAKATIEGVKTVAAGVSDVYGDIKVRALEISAARNAAAEAEEKNANAVRRTADSVDGLSKSYKELRKEAGKASKEIESSLKGAIGKFQNNLRSANTSIGPNAIPVVAALQAQYEALARQIDELSIGLNADQLRDLYDALDEAGFDLGEKIKDAAREGGLGLYAKIKQAIEDGYSRVSVYSETIAGLADVGSGFLDSIDSAIQSFQRAGEKSFLAITRLASEVATSAERGFKDLGGLIGGKIGGVLGSIGNVAGAIGAVTGLISSAVNFFKNLFSSKSSGATFNLQSGASSFARKGPYDQQIADFGSQFSDVAQQFATLLGASISQSLGVRFFVDKNQNILPTVRNLSTNALVALPKGATTDSRGVTSDPEQAIRLALGLTIDKVFKGADATLASVAKSLLDAGSSLEDIVSVVNTVKELTQIETEPASEYERKIKELNATFDAAIASVNGVTSAERKLNAARNQAIAAVTTQYNADIQNQISQFLTSPTQELEKLLETQKARFEEAQRLGADLAQVERLANLELRDFFQGLSDSAVEEVQSFLGLFEEASDSVSRQLDLSRQDLEGMRDSFSQYAQDFAQLQTDFQEKYVAASPRESLDILRARASDLLGQVGEGNASAAQALPQVLNNLVENARQSFGNTKAFQEVLNFANQIASQAEQSANQVVSDTERQIMALDESNDLLSDIKDILSSTQAYNALFQSYSSGGVASSDELLALIQQGVGLTPIANDNAAALSVTSLIAQSMTPIIQPIATSIEGFTRQLSEMPSLQRLTIEATDRVSDAVDSMSDRLNDKLDRIEILEKKSLEELERIAS